MAVYPAASVEEELLDDAARLWWFAERFGWTPDQVEALPGWLEARLPVVAAVADEVAEEAQKAARNSGGRP